MPTSMSTEVTRFLEWFKLLADTDVIDLAGVDPEVPPPPPPAYMLQIIHAAKLYLPLKYQQTYVEPLITNFGSLLARETWNAETYAGAVYQHLDAYEQRTQLQCFLAVISNLYRSFFVKERAAKLGVPTLLRDPGPPLATFKYRPDGLELGLPYFLSAFTIPSDEVERVCGGKVAIVSLPSIYRKHPILWGVLAHEAGGHDVLHVEEELLPELQQLVRTKMEDWAVKNGYDRRNAKRLGELWQYWTEETAADVYGVLNMGPSFGFNLALLIAVLNYQVRPFFEMVGHRYDEINAEREKRSRVLRRTPIARLRPEFRNWSGSPRTKRNLDADLDTHTVEILRLFVIIGVVRHLENFPQRKKDVYERQLRNIARTCLGRTNKIELHGFYQVEADTWHRVDTAIPIEIMRDSALEVGRLLATEPLARFNRNSIQKIQTWDHNDDQAVQEIKEKFLESEKGSVDSMGDDTQLLAGGTMALLGRPKFEISDLGLYNSINDRLLAALTGSFRRDVFWGRSVLHVTVGKPIATSEMVQQMQQTTNALLQKGI